jgi:hypothetical protein
VRAVHHTASTVRSAASTRSGSRVNCRHDTRSTRYPRASSSRLRDLGDLDPRVGVGNRQALAAQQRPHAPLELRPHERRVRIHVRERRLELPDPPPPLAPHDGGVERAAIEHPAIVGTFQEGRKLRGRQDPATSTKVRATAVIRTPSRCVQSSGCSGWW